MRPWRETADIENIAQSGWMVMAMTMVIVIVMTNSEVIAKVYWPYSLREKVEAVYFCKTGSDPV
jgi:hypothetical protein